MSALPGGAAGAAASHSGAAASNASDTQAHLFHFTANKAGMGGVDKAKVNRVVHDMSKNSAHHKHALKQDAKVDARVHAQRLKLESLTRQGAERLLRQVTQIEERLEHKRWLGRVCVVVDMDCYFAAVAMRDDPSLVGKPIAVGGIGMISTANYEARKYGVRSAMPGFIGRKLCPSLVFVKSDFAAYKAASKVVKSVLVEYDPCATMHSLDEAYLDLTPYLKRRHQERRALLEQQQQQQGGGGGGGGESGGSGGGSAREFMADPATVAAVVNEMRSRVKAATNGLSCSAGIAPCFRLAKIASDENKPDGQYVVPATRRGCVDFLHRQPCRKVGGVGKVTEKVLREVLGVNTVAELYAKRAEAYHVFGGKSAEWLVRVAMAIGEDDEYAASVKWVQKGPVKDALSGEGEGEGGEGEGGEGGGGEEGGEGSPRKRGTVTRKGISHERTFSAMERQSEMREKLGQVTCAINYFLFVIRYLLFAICYFLLVTRDY